MYDKSISASGGTTAADSRIVIDVLWTAEKFMCNIIVCLTCLFAFRSRVYIWRRGKKRDYICLAVASTKVFKNFLSRRQSVVVYDLQIFHPLFHHHISTTKLRVLRPPQCSYALVAVIKRRRIMFFYWCLQFIYFVAPSLPPWPGIKPHLYNIRYSDSRWSAISSHLAYILRT